MIGISDWDRIADWITSSEAFSKSNPYIASPIRIQFLADFPTCLAALCSMLGSILRGGGIIMDKDRVEGKVKDVAGRVQRQVGEWTGSTKDQAEGAAKQVEGKVQNAWGKAKDAVKKPGSSEVETEDEKEARERDRAANE
jgi:uncharacterized protein YjbJ (UPF0337 family)